MAGHLGAAWRSRDWLTYGKEPSSAAEVGGYRLLAAQPLSNGRALACRTTSPCEGRSHAIRIQQSNRDGEHHLVVGGSAA